MAVPGGVIVVADEGIAVSVVTAVPVVVTTVAVADDIAVLLSLLLPLLPMLSLIHCQTIYCNSDPIEGPVVQRGA
jgi:hypothetical protein